jgi:hypothetical protein
MGPHFYIMAAIPSTIKASGFHPISMISILYIHPDLSRMLAGVFVKDNTEYFLICMRNGMVYFPFSNPDLSRLLSDRLSLLAFVFRSRRNLKVIPEGKFGLLLLISVWANLAVGNCIRKPNAYYDWHAHLQTRGS